MNVHGDMGDGKFGILSSDALAHKIHERCQKAGLRVTPEEAENLAKAVNDHNGTTSGGGTNYKYNGKTVFHDTPRGAAATIFFAPSKDSADTATIVAIGKHFGKLKNGITNKYQLYWRRGDFRPTTGIQLNKQKKVVGYDNHPVITI
ncbi:MAG: hypothetical protein LBF16_09910 [Pseudomonadales bacterium]|jgi:hypothetical protein|nr:hypothetical protein [Pseudomonadales bacterium]